MRANADWWTAWTTTAGLRRPALSPPAPCTERACIVPGLRQRCTVRCREVASRGLIWALPVMGAPSAASPARTKSRAESGILNPAGRRLPHGCAHPTAQTAGLPLRLPDPRWPAGGPARRRSPPGSRRRPAGGRRPAASLPPGGREEAVVGWVVQIAQIEDRTQLHMLELVEQQPSQGDRVGRQRHGDGPERLPGGGTEVPSVLGCGQGHQRGQARPQRWSVGTVLPLDFLPCCAECGLPLTELGIAQPRGDPPLMEIPERVGVLQDHPRTAHVQRPHGLPFAGSGIPGNGGTAWLAVQEGSQRKCPAGVADLDDDGVANHADGRDLQFPVGWGRDFVVAEHEPPSVGRCTAELITGTVTAAPARARAATAAATAPR